MRDMSSTTLEATIVDLTYDGLGVADLNGKRFFIPGCLPTERVLLAPRKGRRKYQQADLVEILEPAVERVVPPCEYFGRCGGCVLQHLDPLAQLRLKEASVRAAFLRIGGVEPEEWLAPIQGPQWNYRRKARLGVRYVEGKGRVLVGFKERATRLLTDMAHCSVLAAPFDKLLGELAILIGTSTVKRRLPQVEVAVGDSAAAMVLRTLDPPTEADKNAFCEFGRRHHIDVYIQSGGPGTVRALEPDQARTLDYRLETLDLRFEFAPTDFIQINAAVNAAMVEQALGLLNVRPSDRALDLYSGLGNLSLPLAQRADQVTGIEAEAGLVARAVHNAQLNGLENTRFLSGDLNQPEWSFMREHWDLVVLDPPRSGAQVVVEQIGQMNPRGILYISCHPATLARDAEKLVTSQGYRMKTAVVADMFPHTHHVEVMAFFER